MHIHHWHYHGRRHTSRHCCRCDITQDKTTIFTPAVEGWFCKKRRGGRHEVWETVAVSKTVPPRKAKFK